ncbi:uncharacterized protein LOC130823430 [Amaranthus tricolor]|uniref:uncharacterized protein LOC130823430 n=1 Tax=Amaranthus tricolor TaxID=29722 RepID=UPI00258667EE|nr:uncharacterized protein LOC130823430 [Amaranthus tricolor]
MVIGWLISYLERSVAKSVMYYNDARDIWKNLEDRFGQTSSSLLYSLQEDLSRTYQELHMSIAEYYTKVKGLWDEIDNVSPLATCTCINCSCNLTKQYLKDREDQRLIHFLMKLHDNFQQARGNILRMKELPSAAEAYHILLQEQRHQELSKISTSSLTDFMAFAFDKKSTYEKFSSKTRTSQDKKQLGRGFKHCQMSGYRIQRCYKLHGYPNSEQHHSKRTAAFALDSDQDHKIDVHKTGLSVEQFQNLLHYLGKTDAHIAKYPLEVTISANVAATFYFLSSCSNFG